MTSKASWITHPSCVLHQMDAGHPESPARLLALQAMLVRSGLGASFAQIDAPAASREALLRVHDADHVDRILSSRPGSGRLWLDPDTSMSEHSLDAALHAAGAGVLGVERLLNGEADFVFCAVRPPGHHAERDRPMGFCILNNIAVAAAEALARGLLRVAVLDFDVHHGNGTADIFARDPRVRVFNTYQDPLYPYWEGRADAPSLIDMPLPSGSDGAAYRAAVVEGWLPALAAFAPQLLLVSAGFDAHVRDPLAGLRLVDGDYAWTAQRILEIASRYCEGRVIAMLEGGYDLQGLSGGVEAFVRPFVESGPERVD
ncbi:MAG: deacetylase [Hydrocarboniphaga sp.]|uniref:histone deacetylase family protein n=1 Tax=Hydrocarboniphaga sp. TaxID=2033016 RepID=UPI0026140EE3|nr:histone deacetylase family protein [Hydrocarboniphaga sp.]MDB5969132.1 deacetylase [Hydrocarboniphaga sp.]